MTPLTASMIVRQVSRNASGITRIAARASVASQSVANGVYGEFLQRRMASSMSAGEALAKLAAETPHKDVLHYDHKNVKFSLKQVNYHAESLAAGLVGGGLQPGDVVLSWLPLHFSEQVCLFFGDPQMIKISSSLLRDPKLCMEIVPFMFPFSPNFICVCLRESLTY